LEIFTLHHCAVNRGCGGWVPSSSLFAMVVIHGRLFARLRALNPDSPGASTAFVASARFVPVSLTVGRQK